jgi:ribosomal-protein-serine acetyltransferase
MFELKVNDGIQLKLRHESHARETFWLIKKNEDHLRPWMKWLDKVESVSDSVDNIITNLEDWELKTDLHLGIFTDGVMVGMISLHNINYLNHTGYIGYWLDEDNEGKGIITDCVRTMIEYGYTELGLNRIEIRAGVNNTRSRAVPERLGFTQEGMIRQAEYVNGAFIDLAIYSMLKDEYKYNR